MSSRVFNLSGEQIRTMSVNELKKVLEAYAILTPDVFALLEMLMWYNNDACVMEMLQSYTLSFTQLNIMLAKCAEFPCKPILNALLRLGADPNSSESAFTYQSEVGETILRRAVTMLRINCVNCLISGSKHEIKYIRNENDPMNTETLLMACFAYYCGMEDASDSLENASDSLENVSDFLEDASDSDTCSDSARASERKIQNAFKEMTRFLLAKRPDLLHISIAAMASNWRYWRDADPPILLYPSFSVSMETVMGEKSCEGPRGKARGKLVAYWQSLFVIFMAAERFSPCLPTDVWMEHILPCLGPF